MEKPGCNGIDAYTEWREFFTEGSNDGHDGYLAGGIVEEGSGWVWNIERLLED
jgi:hypothetical protein